MTGPSFFRRKRGSRCLDVGRLFALWTLGDFKLHLLAFLQGFETIHLNCREVSEEIFAAIVRSNEAETLGVIEPFNCTSCHNYYLFH